MKTLQWNVLSSSTKTWSWSSWTPFIKTKNDVAFLTGSFLIMNSLNMDISTKKKLCSTVDLFSVASIILFNIYKIYKRFYYSQGGLEVLKLQYVKHLYQRHIQNLLKHLRWRPFLKAVKPLKQIFILDIWGLNKLIDCNMYYGSKVTLKIY